MNTSPSRWSDWFSNLLTPRCPPAITGLLLVLSVLFVVQMLLPAGRIQSIDIAFYLFGLIVFFGYAGSIRRSLPAWAMLAAGIQLTATWLFLLKDYPELARSGPSLEDYLDKFGFIFIALVLAGRDRWVVSYLGILGLLVLAMPWVLGGGVSDLVSGIDVTMWVGSGVNPARAAMYYSLVLFGLLAFFRRLLFAPRLSWFRLLLWLGLAGYCLFCILATRAVGVYISLVLSLLAGLVFLIVLGRYSRSVKRWLGASLFMLMLVPMYGVLASGGLDGAFKRMVQEPAGVHEQIAREDGSGPVSAWQERFRFASKAFDRVIERPVVGWGYRSGRALHAAEAGWHDHGHQLHNAYLELTLQYGVGGLLILILLFAWTLRGTYQAWRAGVMPNDVFAYAISSIFFFLFCAFFYELFFDDDAGLMMLSVLLGVSVSYVFSHSHGRTVVQSSLW